MITLTTIAHDQLKKNITGATLGVKISVKKSGCTGYAYSIDTVDTIATTDLVYPIEGVNIIIDQNSAKFLEGTQLDYVRDGLNRAFKFNNPNVVDACGCGLSVRF
jgi:iron-sulfur cluster assembly protein